LPFSFRTQVFRLLPFPPLLLGGEPTLPILLVPPRAAPTWARSLWVSSQSLRPQLATVRRDQLLASPSRAAAAPAWVSAAQLT
jgi:hypothetical protein